MLGKEDVLLWFKDLESYKRIDVMYELLNMCVPFEVRFLGSCIEEIGKHTFQELRSPTLCANDVDRLAKDPSLQMDLADESTRHRAVIYMSVLSARNSVGASWYFRTLFRTSDPIEHVLKLTGGREECQNVVSELLLLYTLGLHHPAFSFEQKTSFSNALKRLQSHATCGSHVQEAVKPQVFAPRNASSQNDVPTKTATVMPGGDSLPTQPHPPPPLSANVFSSRTAFPSGGTVVGAPEVRPFPAQPAPSPSSPLPSRRATSPMRPIRLTGMSQPSLLPLALQNLDATPLALDSGGHAASQIVLAFNSPSDIPLKGNDEGNYSISEDKQASMNDLLKQNGLRSNFSNMKVDDKSNSSSGSSRNQSPAETPALTPSVTPQGPGRGGSNNNLAIAAPQPPPGETNARVNGLPTPPAFIAPCDNQPPFSTVPSYSSFQRYYIRPHYINQYAPIPSNEVIFTIPCVYSSVMPQPGRNLNCCNCGSIAHTSVECREQSVESMLQPHYALEYEPSLVPDHTPEK